MAASDYDNTMNSYKEAMRRMKFMQPDPPTGNTGIGTSTPAGSAGNNIDDFDARRASMNVHYSTASVATDTTKDRGFEIHNYGGTQEDLTMSAYMAAMAQAEAGRNAGPPYRSANGLPVQDVEIVDDSNSVPAGITDLEEQVDHAAQSYFEEKQHLEEETARVAKDFKEAAKAAATEIEPPLEKKQEDDDPLSGTDIPRHDLMEAAMKKYYIQGAPISDPTLAKSIPPPTKVKGGIPMFAEVEVANEDATLQTVFQEEDKSREVLMEAAMKKFKEVGPLDARLVKGRDELMKVAMRNFEVKGPLGANLAKNRDQLMEAAMQKFKEFGPIDAKLADILPKQTKVGGGIPKWAEVPVIEGATPKTVFLPATVDDSYFIPRAVLMDGAMERFKTEGPLDATLAKNRDQLMEAAAKRFEAMGPLGDKDAKNRDQLMETAMKKFQECGPTDANLAETISKSKKVEAEIPKHAEIQIAEDDATPQSVFLATTASNSNFIARAHLMDEAMKKFHKNGPLDAHLAKSREELMEDAMKNFEAMGPLGASVAKSRDQLMEIDMHKFKAFGAIDTKLAEFLPKPTKVKGGIPNGAEVPVVEGATPQAVFQTSIEDPLIQISGEVLSDKECISRAELMEAAMKKFKEFGPIDAKLAVTLSKATRVSDDFPKAAEVAVAGEDMTLERIFHKENTVGAMRQYFSPPQVGLGGDFLNSAQDPTRSELMEIAMKKFNEGCAELAARISKPVGGGVRVPKAAVVPAIEEGATPESVFKGIMPSVEASSPEWIGSPSCESSFKQQMDYAIQNYSNPSSVQLEGELEAKTREQLMEAAMEKYHSKGIDSTLARTLPKPTGIVGGILKSAEIQAAEEGLTIQNIFEATMPSVDPSSPVWKGSSTEDSTFKPEVTQAVQNCSKPVSITMGGELLRGEGFNSREQLMETAMSKFAINGPINAELEKDLPTSTGVAGGIPKGAELEVSVEPLTPERILRAAIPPTPDIEPTWVGMKSSISAFSKEMEKAAKVFAQRPEISIGGDITNTLREKLMEVAMQNFHEVGPADAELYKNIAKSSGVRVVIPDGAELSVTEESTTQESIFKSKEANKKFFASPKEWVGRGSTKSVFEEEMNEAVQKFGNPVHVKIGGDIISFGTPTKTLMEDAMEDFKTGRGGIDAGLYPTFPKARGAVNLAKNSVLPAEPDLTTPEHIFAAIGQKKARSIRAWIGTMASKSVFKQQMDIAVANYLNPPKVTLGGELLTASTSAASEKLMTREALMACAMDEYNKNGPADAELAKALSKSPSTTSRIPRSAEVMVANEGTTPESLFLCGLPPTAGDFSSGT